MLAVSPSLRLVWDFDGRQGGAIECVFLCKSLHTLSPVDAVPVISWRSRFGRRRALQMVSDTFSLPLALIDNLVEGQLKDSSVSVVCDLHRGPSRDSATTKFRTVQVLWWGQNERAVGKELA
jgi:hypothetical protein